MSDKCPSCGYEPEPELSVFDMPTNPCRRKQLMSKSQNAMLVNVRCVAEMLDCSWRHVYRMADDGRMPPPVKIGGMVRWRREELDAWIENGCPPTGIEKKPGNKHAPSDDGNT